MTFLDRDGVQIHYEVVGAGVPVLLSHGYCASGRMFASTLAALAPAYRCITWDLRGHGRSDYPEEQERYSVELTLGDMLALLDVAEVDRAVLIGHSLGGYLSLAMQAAHPERVAGLVLVGTGPGYRSEDGRKGWNELCESFAVALETRGFDGLPGGSEEMQADAHRNLGGLVRAARGILPQRDATILEHLPDIDVPTLVVVGSRDRRFLAGSSYMAKKIPGATTVVIEGAGHAPMISHPEEFNSAVTEFLPSSGPHPVRNSHPQ